MEEQKQKSQQGRFDIPTTPKTNAFSNLPLGSSACSQCWHTGNRPYHNGAPSTAQYNLVELCSGTCSTCDALLSLIWLMKWRCQQGILHSAFHCWPKARKIPSEHSFSLSLLSQPCQVIVYQKMNVHNNPEWRELMHVVLMNEIISWVITSVCVCQAGSSRALAFCSHSAFISWAPCLTTTLC